MDIYLERLRREGYLDSNGAATWELNWGPSLGVQNLDLGSSSAPDRDVPTTSNACNRAVSAECELNQELKKIKKHLKQMIDLQKQANLMAAGFYCAIIALFLFYMLFIRR